MVKVSSSEMSRDKACQYELSLNIKDESKFYWLVFNSEIFKALLSTAEDQRYCIDDLLLRARSLFTDSNKNICIYEESHLEGRRSTRIGYIPLMLVRSGAHFSVGGRKATGSHPDDLLPIFST